MDSEVIIVAIVAIVAIVGIVALASFHKDKVTLDMNNEVDGLLKNEIAITAEDKDKIKDKVSKK